MSIETATSPTRKYGVLVADDQPSILEALSYGMKKAGFRVWAAADGQEALRIYRQEQAEIDVVLLDVCMPVLNGPDALMAIKEITPDVRCCFMSGFLGEYTEDDLHKLGAAKFIRKPFQLSTVAQELLTLASGAPRGMPRLQRDTAAMEQGTIGHRPG